MCIRDRSIVAGYFLLLIFLAWITSRGSTTDDFFINRHKSPWYLVAIGMIGSSLSGVTFISIPGVVGAGGHNQAFSYMQVVLGYLLGYMTISLVLMPLYYRLNLISIYGYLGMRFGPVSYKTGSAFFMPVSYTHLDVYKRQILFPCTFRNDIPSLSQVRKSFRRTNRPCQA